MKLPVLALGFLCVGLTTGAAIAVEPAGGPATPPLSIDDFKTRAGAADDAMVEAQGKERAWLAKSSRHAMVPAENSHGSVLLNLTALLLLLGLAGGALYLKKRRSVSPTKQVAQTIKVLSQVRVGPKAQLVTTEIAGRVLLLGVTESSVSCLSWLDAPNDVASDLKEEVPENADFSDGYAAHAPPGPSYGRVALAATERFREVMNGVLRTQKSGSEAREPVPTTNVAQLLARETKDIVHAAPLGVTEAASAPPSSGTSKATPRRTRRKLESLPLETQVAGLVARHER